VAHRRRPPISDQLLHRGGQLAIRQDDPGLAVVEPMLEPWRDQRQFRGTAMAPAAIALRIVSALKILLSAQDGDGLPGLARARLRLRSRQTRPAPVSCRCVRRPLSPTTAGAMGRRARLRRKTSGTVSTRAPE
jgi:hypothetical protein